MAIVTEDFSATPADWTSMRGGTALSLNSDGTGAAKSATNEALRKEFDLGGLDQFCECSVVGAGADSNRSLFLYARMISTMTSSTTNTYYYALTINVNASTLTLLRYPTHTSAQPQPSTTSYTFPAAPFVLRLEVTRSGSVDTLRGFVNGTQIATGSNNGSGNYQGTRAGLGFYNAGTANPSLLRVDNWRAGLLSDPLPATGPEPGRGLLAA